MVALNVVGCDVKNRIVVVYRPPYSDGHAQSTMNDIPNCRQELTAVRYSTIIAGDVNLRIIDWSNICWTQLYVLLSFHRFRHRCWLNPVSYLSHQRWPCPWYFVVKRCIYCIVPDCWVESPLGFNSIISKSSDHNTVHFNIHRDVASSTDVYDDFIYTEYANDDFIALIISCQLNGSQCCWTAMMSTYIGTTLCAYEHCYWYVCTT